MNDLPTELSPIRKLLAVLALAGATLLIDGLVAGAPAAAQTPVPSPDGAAALTAGDAARGHNKAATCLGCHSIPDYKADFPVVYRVPMIGGQNAQYIESALKAYKKGERRFPSMMATAKSLSDQDIADVAAYFAAQR